MAPAQPASPSTRLVHLDNYRGLAIAMVVATHALGYAHLPANEQHQIAWMVQTIAVPVFFLVDGLLFGIRHDAKTAFDYREYLAKSMHRLLIPWALFTLLYGVLRLMFELTGSAPAHILVGRPWQDWITAIYLSDFSSQMYFLLSLFFIRAAAPPLHILAQCGLPIRVLAVIVYLGAFHLLPLRTWFFPGLDPIYHALWGLQFYLIGLVIPLVSGFLATRGIALSLVTLAGGILLPILSDHTVIPAQFLLLIGSYIAFASTTFSLRVLSTLGRYTMGIYLLHIPLVMKGMALIFSRILPPTSLSFFFCLAFFSLITSLFLTKMLLQLPFGRQALGEQAQGPGPGTHAK